MPPKTDPGVRRVRAVSRRLPRALEQPASPALTTRAAVLGLVLCALVVIAAVPVREFLSQRAAITATRSAQAAQRERVAALERQQAQLQDPAFVRAQARQRLHLVLPGETAYQLLAPAPTAASRRQRRQASGDGATAPWYSSLWSSVRVADRVGGRG